MKLKILVVAVSLMVVAALAGLAGCSAKGVAAAESPPPVNVTVGNQQTGIWVSGEGKITVTPDLATLSLGVSAQSLTVAAAQADAARAMDQIMNALTNKGVARKDVQTSFYNIQQLTRWDDKGQTPIVIGYLVNNTVTAKIREMNKVGEVIDAVAAAGGDFTRIQGIGFSVEKPERFHQQVRELALKDAKAKAEQIASLTGVTLGLPTFVSEASSPSSAPQPYKRMEAMAAGASVPDTAIFEGELNITLSVQVVYAIK
ncbi:MAG TPA: SIMPL domain-containing protein [Dehalococcoidales bacterium]|nr:SIMPL domain-containing protein [Dehalococcoidales bacterium]